MKIFCELLIVPYGIETTLIAPFLECAVLLLIVPYGIETLYRPQTALKTCLLIVPYGIETYEAEGFIALVNKLLIVPYGIETYENVLPLEVAGAFNRTLWN